MMENHTTDMNRAFFSKRFGFLSAFCPCEQILDFHTPHARFSCIDCYEPNFDPFRSSCQFQTVRHHDISLQIHYCQSFTSFFLLQMSCNYKLHGESSTNEHAYTCRNEEKFSFNLQCKTIIQNSFTTCSKITRLSIFCVFLNWVSLYRSRHSEQAFEC